MELVKKVFTMKRSLISFGLTLLLAVLLHPVMAQVESERDDPDAGNPIRPLDIVLLVDSSESTRDSDPEGLRTRASKFLLDYVLAAGESIGLNHRFALLILIPTLLIPGHWTCLHKRLCVMLWFYTMRDIPISFRL